MLKFIGLCSSAGSVAYPCVSKTYFGWIFSEYCFPKGEHFYSGSCIVFIRRVTLERNSYF